jgi:hypothetical protein
MIFLNKDLADFGADLLQSGHGFGGRNKALLGETKLIEVLVVDEAESGPRHRVLTI